MHTFLEETLDTILKSTADLEEAIFVLPSKRACGFLKQNLLKKISKPIFAPKILSIEEFIVEISGLQIIDPIQLQLLSYQVYLEVKEIREKDGFDTFNTYYKTLINDFNEIDRNLVEVTPFFNYLSSIKTLEKWGVVNNTTPLIKNYLDFWQQLPLFYDALTTQLLSINSAYQGLVYRKAAEDIEHYINSVQHKKHYLLGFNALNKAEQVLFQELLEMGNTQVFWDIDHYFVADKDHSASLFCNGYFNSWNYYKTQTPLGLSNYFTTQKKLNFVATSSVIEQVKYVGQVLQSYTAENLQETAIVLANEELLIPLLYALPKNINEVNITMGFPLSKTPYCQFFIAYLKLKNKLSHTLYYKDVKAIIGDPFLVDILNNANSILKKIKDKNVSYISYNTLYNITPEADKPWVALLFNPNENDAQTLILNLITLVQAKYNTTLNFFEKACLQELYETFLGVTERCNTYTFLNNTESITLFLIEMLQEITLDFEGNAYQGLQIMGVLETRVIDFKNIIVLSVNEGVLPSGKSNNSFITFDMKVTYNLPLFTDKDAVYSYHFYHLIQRAKNATFLYTEKTEGLTAGEKSRFLLQLEIAQHPNHNLSKTVVTTSVQLEKTVLKEIQKCDAILNKIKKLTQQGFSPSSLSLYIKNPILFYEKKILNIKELNTIEETIAYNTLGTIVHACLENLYLPFTNQYLNINQLEGCKEAINKEVEAQLKHYYIEGQTQTGKNLIIKEVIKKYIENLIDIDITLLKEGNEIKLLYLEKKLEGFVKIPAYDNEIKLKGTVDRIDVINGTVRIIDYKTGTVNKNELELTSWDNLHTQYKFSKAFQVLCYSYLYQLNFGIKNPLEAGIISFKNLQLGFMPFAQKEKANSRKKDTSITQDTLVLFKEKLDTLLLEITNPSIPFIEKEEL